MRERLERKSEVRKGRYVKKGEERLERVERRYRNRDRSERRGIIRIKKE